MRGRTNSDIRRLTATTMTSGSAASAIGGPTSLGRPWIASGGSNVLAVVARSRTTRSSAAFSCGTSAPYPSPLARALRSARPSHHMPKPNMTIAAINPSPGAAKGVVPKNGIGIAF